MTVKTTLTITLLFSLFAAGQVLAAKTGPNVGDKAPGFSLSSLASKRVSLDELTKKGHVLVIFWSTRCHACKTMLPDFKKTYNLYQNSKLTLVAINVGFEDINEVKQYASAHGIHYLILNEDSKKSDIASRYNLQGTPTVKLIAPNGIIKWSGHHIPDLKRWVK